MRDRLPLALPADLAPRASRPHPVLAPRLGLSFDPRRLVRGPQPKARLLDRLGIPARGLA